MKDLKNFFGKFFRVLVTSSLFLDQRDPFNFSGKKRTKLERMPEHIVGNYFKIYGVWSEPGTWLGFSSCDRFCRTKLLWLSPSYRHRARNCRWLKALQMPQPDSFCKTNSILQLNKLLPTATAKKRKSRFLSWCENNRSIHTVQDSHALLSKD